MRSSSPCARRARKSRCSTRCSACRASDPAELPQSPQDRGDRREGRLHRGINVTDDENERIKPDDYYRDVHARLEGDVVGWMQRVFLEDWHYVTGKTPEGEGYFVQQASGPYAVQVIPSGPDNEWEPIHRAHLTGIDAAKARVWLVTPYFVPTEAALYAFTSAALRGLDVRLMLPRKSDSRLVDLAARSYFDALLAAGVRVYEYQPRMLHSKALLIDDAFVILGSANFDGRSFRTNFELGIACTRPSWRRRSRKSGRPTLPRASRSRRTDPGGPSCDVSARRPRALCAPLL